MRFKMLEFLMVTVALAISLQTQAAYDGFYYDQTTFSDGWVSTVKPDWVEGVNGNVKVMLHYPRVDTDFKNGESQDVRLATAWSILVASRYSNIQGYSVSPTAGSYQAGDIASALATDNATGNTVYLVLFRNWGGRYWMEFVAHDKQSFINLMAVNIDAITFNTSSDYYQGLNLSGLNRFAVHPSDLAGEWTNNFASMQTFYSLYTGATLGTYTYHAYETFNYKSGTTYDWKIQVVQGYEFEYGFSEATSSGSFTVSPWQIQYSWIENRPRSYDAYFSCIKNGRLLWMLDHDYPGSGTFTPYGKSASNTSGPTVPSAPNLTKLVAKSKKLQVHFTPPTSDGGATIAQYTATCTPTAAGTSRSTSGGSSPVFVTGLINGTRYQCGVVATNSAGNSLPSSLLTATPRADIGPVLNLLLH